ncbi:glutaredoxin family protein [Psychrobium sp. MM17-31]|uniref:glutaredoxin family protein n=1 Tax=Psychrobium sp. MM17-31 TaxID=2917758 RepID=UPI001EF4A15E|nr:glutaredoxin family protein [Psychrobium sp. MM17-31]MCG7529777.1 glutaredoxin family protein [Psychrobium sp. MM17-31]
MSKEVILYSTDGCHLCELAQAQLDELQVAYRVVDIIDDSELVERYGIRIPVVLNQQQQELGWPFELPQLQAFLG